MRNFEISWNLETGLNADKFATFWMFPITHSSSSVYDPCTLYNQLNASPLALFPKTGKHVNQGKT